MVSLDTKVVDLSDSAEDISCQGDRGVNCWRGMAVKRSVFYLFIFYDGETPVPWLQRVILRGKTGCWSNPGIDRACRAWRQVGFGEWVLGGELFSQCRREWCGGALLGHGSFRIAPLGLSLPGPPRHDPLGTDLLWSLVLGVLCMCAGDRVSQHRLPGL